MSSNPVYSQIRRSNRNTLLLSIVGLIIVVVVFVMFFLPYITANASAPRPLTAADITAASANISDLQPMYNVTVSGDSVFANAYEEYTENETTGAFVSTDAYFSILEVEGTLLLVRTKEEIDDNTFEFTGMLVQPSGIGREAMTALASDLPDNPAFTVLLDTVTDQTAWIVGGVVLGLLFLAVLYGFVSFFTRSANPGNHPIMKRLKPLGEPETILSEIENERIMGEQKVGDVAFTRNWMIYAKGNDFQAVRRSDLAWAYKQVTQNRSVKSFFAYIYDRHGRFISIPGKEDAVNQTLTAILNYAPWTIAGYSNEIKQSWDKDRAGFLAAVDDRKRQSQQPRQ
jgi:hypothetical protein